MRRAWVLAALAACNQVYGLDETKIADNVGDTDVDGVRDDVDNCVRIANPDQTDVDGDGKGDACALICMPGSGTRMNADRDRDRIDDGCDPCPRSPQIDAQGRVLDEDGDGVYDACDNCPGTPNPDQANNDGDDLGNACDVFATARVVFDPFWRAQQFWQTPWKVDNGVVHADPLLGKMGLRGLELVYAANQGWFAELGIDVASLTADGTVGFDVTVASCKLERSATGLQVVARSPSSTPSTAPLPPTSGIVRLRGFMQDSGPFTAIRCYANGVEATVTVDSIESVSVPFLLVTDVSADITYVDITN